MTYKPPWWHPWQVRWAKLRKQVAYKIYPNIREDYWDEPQLCTRPGHACTMPEAGPCNGYPRGGFIDER